MIERSFWALRQSAGSQSGGVALKKICLNELEEFIVFEQPAKPLPTRVRTPARAWGPSRRGSWDRIYRLSLRWLRLSRDCEQQNPSSTGPFRTRNYLEAAPIGSKPSCKADTDPRSYGELLKLPDSKERLRARTRTLPHRAHLGAVPRPAAREGSRPPARLPPTPRPRSGGLREAHRGPRLRLRLLAHSRRDVFGYHYKAQA